MRSSAVAIALVLFIAPAGEAQYKEALPGYHYEFPRDYFDHPEYQTEWWYTTGNVKTADGRRFGFELTFFREGVSRDAAKTNAWDVRDLYLAHLALSDLDGGKFHHTERLNRAGPGIAGASEKEGRVWNGNWKIAWKGGEQELDAVSEEFSLHFKLRPEKAPVIEGVNGVSQKAEGAGRASHYISLTRLDTKGEITLHGKEFSVSGLAWMDHEFFTHQLEANQIGWDWMSIQLQDKTELMLFRIRGKDGTIGRFSAGTFVEASGRTEHLSASDFQMEPAGRTWTSPATGATYPMEWKLSVPKLGVELSVTTPLASQEMTGTSSVAPNYWEGAIELNGTKGAERIAGVGYLEMTGYDRAVQTRP
ncbi:MAG TPA: lipocalin-like domain-containing protein [Terriglobales bacterium]|nr:lipocalin-like domain-containing protein [Terriglobales bacterium]